MTKKILFIENWKKWHCEIIESILVKYTKIIGTTVNIIYINVQNESLSLFPLNKSTFLFNTNCLLIFEDSGP